MAKRLKGLDIGSRLTQEEIELFAKLLDFYQNYQAVKELPWSTRQYIWEMVYQLCRGSASWVRAFFGTTKKAVESFFRKRNWRSIYNRNAPPWEFYYEQAKELRESGKIKSVIEELAEDMTTSPATSAHVQPIPPAPNEPLKAASQEQEQETTEKLPELHDDKLRCDYYKQRCQKLERKLERLQHEYIRLQMTWERFSEYVLERLSAYPKRDYPNPKQHKGTKDPHIAMMDLSDIHVGELVKAEETMGLAAYDWDTFLRRKQAYLEGLVRVIEDVKKDHPMEIGIIHALGDWATGERNFPLQLAQLDKFLNEQIIDGAAELAELIQHIATLFPRLYVYMVPGNHSAGKDLTLTLDLLIYHFIATLLREQDNIRFIISKAPYLGYELSPRYVPIEYKHNDWCWRYLLTHGHMVRRHYGIPYYGLDRLVARITKTTGVVWDAVFAAHHHEEARTRHWWVNGSWVGGSKLSVEKMQAAEPACQWFRLWHPHWGISWQLEIYLEDPKQQLEPDEFGIYGPATVHKAEEVQ